MQSGSYAVGWRAGASSVHSTTFARNQQRLCTFWQILTCRRQKSATTLFAISIADLIGCGRVHNRRRQRRATHVREFALGAVLVYVPPHACRDQRLVRIAFRAIEIASNSLRVELGCWEFSHNSLWLAFEEQSGWLMASVKESSLPPDGSVTRPPMVPVT
jgi:hypothetical protein